MRKVLEAVLKVLAKLMLARWRPVIIGITGNVGKTSAREAVFAALSREYRVRRSEKNYNNELGFPLAILGIPSGGRNPFRWAFLFLTVLARLVGGPYPQVLVLEMGVDKPGDMDYLLSIAQPDIAVFTSVGDIPVHVEQFVRREELVAEKLKLMRGVREGGTVIYNADVPAWEDGARHAHTKAFSYGFSKHADIKVSAAEYRFGEREGKKVPVGIALKIEHHGNVVPLRLDGVCSVQAGAYAAAAACATGIALGMHLVEISAALPDYIQPRGRLCLVEGMRGSMILDDTYNASPSSMEAALDALENLPADRRVAVLGDMLELGTYSEETHKEAGIHAAKAANILVTVGARMRFAAAEAAAHGFAEGRNLFSFETSDEASGIVADIIQEGDLVLVKGSQGMRMEKVVKAILAHPEHAKRLLVRQEGKWLES